MVSYPLRLLLTVALTFAGAALIAAIVVAAPSFLLGMLLVVPIVPLLRLVGDIANPDVAVPLRLRVLLRRYLGVLVYLVLSLGAVALVIPVAAVGLSLVAAALIVLLAATGLALWAAEHGLGISMARPFAFEEWQGMLLLLGAGLAVGALAAGVARLGLMAKNRLEAPFWRAVHRLLARVEAIGNE